jgi:hypothetical protein
VLVCVWCECEFGCVAPVVRGLFCADGMFCCKQSCSAVSFYMLISIVLVLRTVASTRKSWTQEEREYIRYRL